MSAIEEAESRLNSMGARLAALECKYVRCLSNGTTTPKQYRLSQIRHCQSELCGYRSCLLDKNEDSDSELLDAVKSAIKAVDEIRAALSRKVSE